MPAPNEDMSKAFSCVKALPKIYSKCWQYRYHQQLLNHQTSTVMLLHAGKVARKVYKTLAWATEGDKDKFDKVLEAFE